MTARFVGKTDLTHDLAEFVFELDRAQPFLAGQYALIGVDGVDGPRAYSMCNLAGETSRWHFQIKRTPNGAMTRHLFERLAEGDSVSIDGPFGTAFLQTESERDILCLAGGSGLSPMIAIARAAAAHPALSGRRFDFVFGGRRPEDVCGEEILRELPGFGSTLHFHAAISEEMPDGSWDGHRGFVHSIAETLFGDDLQHKEIYFAGPPMMAQAVQKMLFEHQVPPEQVHFDEFY